MRTLDQWFLEYGQSHQNPVNVRIHKFCVPAIFWSLLGVLVGFHHLFAMILLIAILTLGLCFYAFLGPKVFILMLVSVAACLASFEFLQRQGVPLLPVSLTVFVVAWVGQFIGHRIEGRKPSFLQDLQFLLIGPLWVMKGLFRS